MLIMMNQIHQTDVGDSVLHLLNFKDVRRRRTRKDEVIRRGDGKKGK